MVLLFSKVLSPLSCLLYSKINSFQIFLWRPHWLGGLIAFYIGLGLQDYRDQLQTWFMLASKLLKELVFEQVAFFVEYL